MIIFYTICFLLVIGWIIIFALLIGTFLNYRECGKIKKQMEQDKIKRTQEFERMIQEHYDILTN